MNADEGLRADDQAAVDLATARRNQQVWERLWVESMGRPWSTLALVPACRHGDAAFAVDPLVEVGNESLGGGVHAVRAEGTPLAECRALIESLEARRRACGRSIVSVDSPQKSQVGLLIARAADVAILIVSVDADEIAGTRDTIEALGREHFVGSLLVHASWQ